MKRQTKRHARQRIPGYTPEDETAKQLNVAVRTLRKWRQLGDGPPYVKVGRQVYYSDESCVAWLKSLVVQPVTQRNAQVVA